MDAKTKKNRIGAKVWFWLPLSYGIHGFAVRDAPEKWRKSDEIRWKIEPANRHLAMRRFFGSWALGVASRTEKVLQRALRDSKTLKNPGHQKDNQMNWSHLRKRRLSSDGLRAWWKHCTCSEDSYIKKNKSRDVPHILFCGIQYNTWNFSHM